MAKNQNSEEVGNFIAAVRSADLKWIADDLQKNPALVNCHDKNNLGVTPLHHAAERGFYEVASLLLARGANPNEPATSGKHTPLHVATKSGNRDFVGLLLAHGADPNCQDDKGDSVCHVAVRGGLVGILEALLATGKADVKLKNHRGDVLRDTAKTCRRSDMVKWLDENNCGMYDYRDLMPPPMAAATFQRAYPTPTTAQASVLPPAGKTSDMNHTTAANVHRVYPPEMFLPQRDRLMYSPFVTMSQQNNNQKSNHHNNSDPLASGSSLMHNPSRHQQQQQRQRVDDDDDALRYRNHQQQQQQPRQPPSASLASVVSSASPSPQHQQRGDGDANTMNESITTTYSNTNNNMNIASLSPESNVESVGSARKAVSFSPTSSGGTTAPRDLGAAAVVPPSVLTSSSASTLISANDKLTQAIRSACPRCASFEDRILMLETELRRTQHLLEEATVRGNSASEKLKRLENEFDDEKRAHAAEKAHAQGLETRLAHHQEVLRLFQQKNRLGHHNPLQS